MNTPENVTPAGARDDVTDGDAFADWLAREMPPGTIISNPYWWAPRIIRALNSLTGKADGTHVFNCRRCPVSVVSRWLEPTCPECGDPTELDATAKPQRIELCELHGSQYVRGCAYCTGDLDTLEATQPAATGAVEYDRDLIARILLDYRATVCGSAGSFTAAIVNAQIEALFAADSRDAAGVHTATRAANESDHPRWRLATVLDGEGEESHHGE